MFNIFSEISITWFDIFCNANWGFYFLIAFTVNFVHILLSKSNSNFFYNICLYIVIATIFLFYNNVGAYAGFLFLCEIVSLFSIFIILSRIKNDLLNIKEAINQKLLTFIFLLTTLIFFLYKLNFTKTITNKSNYYSYEFMSSNDFFSVLSLFYTNTYNIFIFINFFLVLISNFVILIGAIYKQSKFELMYSTQSMLTALNCSLERFFNENNFIVFKNKTFISFFKKKTC